MKITNISFGRFCDEFNENRNDTYTYKGKRALFDYLEEYEESTGEEFELDIVGLCCEWVEYENLQELKKDYADIKNIEDLQNATQVIEIDGGGIIIQSY